MDECEGLIVCKIKLLKNTKDVGRLARNQRYVGLEFMLFYCGFIEKSTSLVSS